MAEDPAALLHFSICAFFSFSPYYFPNCVDVDNMGKVHGSLARAGKVRNQTPKVAKKEKKKSPVGRSKKRLTYNKRFLTTPLAPGMKRKCNPQAAGKMG